MTKILATISLCATLSLAYTAGGGVDNSGNSVVIGNGSAGSAGADVTATNSVAIGSGTATHNDRDVAVGVAANASNSSVALGTAVSSSGLNSVAVGYNTTATGNYSTAIGQYSSAIGANSIALGFGSTANSANVLSVGRGIENGDATDNFKRVINVADPINLHDAVNLNYLQNGYYDKTQIDTMFSSIPSGVSQSYVDTAVQGAKNYTDEQISALRQEMKKETYKAVALAAALSSSATLESGKNNAIGLGLGNYKGMSAIALNGAHRYKNALVQYGLSRATANDVATKVSISFGF